MDIRLEPGETLEISIKGMEGVIYHLSSESIKEMGKRVVDGLSPEEVALLRDKKRFNAVKHLRARTGKSFKDAKEVISAYCAKHGCCDKWPMCTETHQTGIEGLEVEKLKSLPFGSKAMMFTYPGPISVEDAKKLQAWAGLPPKEYGFFSFYTCDDASKWSCKAKQAKKTFK